MSNIFLEEVSCKAKNVVVIKSATAPLEDSEFLYLANPNGLIHYKKGSGLKTFIDLTKLVAPGGFHGMEFHPSFNENGLFYLHYSLRDSGKRTPEVNELTAAIGMNVGRVNGQVNQSTMNGQVNQSTMNGQVNGMNGQVNGVNGQVNGMNGQVNGMNGQVNGMNGQVNGMNGQVNGMNGQVNGMNGQLNGQVNQSRMNGQTNQSMVNGNRVNTMNGGQVNNMNQRMNGQTNQGTVNGTRVNTMSGGQVNTMSQSTLNSQASAMSQTTLNGRPLTTQSGTLNGRIDQTIVDGQPLTTQSGNIQNGTLNGRIDQTMVDGTNKPITSHWNGSTYHHVDVLEEWIYIKDDSGDYATKVSTLLKIKIPFEDKTYDTLSLSPKYKKLMISLPDGGNGDPHNLAQNSKMLYGKLLAINVDSEWCNCTESQPPIMSICDIPAGCRRDNFTLIGKGLCTPFSYDESDCGWILDNNPSISEINVFKGDIPVNFGWKVFSGKLPVLVNDRVKYPEEIYRVDNHEPIVVSKERLVGGVTYYGEVDELYESYVVLKERTGLYILNEGCLEKVQLRTLPKGFTHFTSLGSDNGREYLIVGTNVGTFEVKGGIGSRNDEDGFKYTD